MSTIGKKALSSTAVSTEGLSITALVTSNLHCHMKWVEQGGRLGLLWPCIARPPIKLHSFILCYGSSKVPKVSMDDLGFPIFSERAILLCNPEVWNHRIHSLPAYETCCYTTSRSCRNQSTVSGHGLVRSVGEPKGGPSLVHSDRMWSAVCSGAPHRQAAEGRRPQRYMLASKRPTPVRRRFKVTHSLRGRSAPGGMFVPGRMVSCAGFIISCQSCFHCSIRLNTLKEVFISVFLHHYISVWHGLHSFHVHFYSHINPDYLAHFDT